MRIFALELNNEIKGIAERKQYIESLIAELDRPEFVVLPELALCSYMANEQIWQYADKHGKDTSQWALAMAQKYNTYLGVGYLDWQDGDYYNRYMIASPQGVCGFVSKSEGETAVFKNGWFGNIIKTPIGNIAIGICYDSKRKHFYDNIKNETISLILFPHGCPADPKKPEEEINTIDFLCNSYVNAFHVPVVYANSVGKLEYMPGMMGKMMKKAGFRMNGRSRIYAEKAKMIKVPIKKPFIGVEATLQPRHADKEITFYGNDLIKGNTLFRELILKPDVKAGLKQYSQAILKERQKRQ